MVKDAEGWLYTDVVKDHFLNPRNVLTVPEDEYDADGVGYVGSPACGDMMKVYIKVDRDTDQVKDMKWKTYGCASAIGSTSMLSEMVLEKGGLSLNDALKITPRDIMERLGGLPDRKIHCSVLGDKALKEAAKDYFRKSGREHLVNEEQATIVCNCMEITDKDIEEAVLEGADDFEKLQEATKISTSCGECEKEARAILQQYVEKYYGEG